MLRGLKDKDDNDIEEKDNFHQNKVDKKTKASDGRVY